MAMTVRSSVFGRMIYTYRERNKVAIATVAKDSGICHNDISKYETGRKSITVDHFIKIMNVMGYDVKISIRGHGKEWEKISSQ